MVPGMSRVSVELVARDAETLEREVGELTTCLPDVSTINIPDLMRFRLRSWDAAGLVADRFKSVIPHIRAIDVDPAGPLPGADNPALTELLVVQGDPPADLSHRTFPNTSESVIRRYRKEAPHLTIYAAFDPYRRAPYQELEAVGRKKDAGASGFFTQPVFDHHMLDLCRDWLRDETVFWGFSPVVGPRSRSYWETTNHIVFPKDFEPTLDANVAFADAAIRKIRKDGGNIYLMPVRVKVAAYLGPLAEALRS